MAVCRCQAWHPTRDACNIAVRQHRRFRWNQASRTKSRHGSENLVNENGAPEEIRTPDPQIRSLVLYPAELRARRVVAIGSAAQWQEGAMARRGFPARLCPAGPATRAEWFSNHGFLTMRAGAAVSRKLDRA